MNEMRGLGVAPPPKCLDTVRSAKVASEFLPVEAKGMAHLDRRKDWGTCVPDMSFLLCLFVWPGWGLHWAPEGGGDVMWL